MNAPQFATADREPGPSPVLLTVDDYLLLDASGALDRHGKTELIEGVILAMNSQYRPHGRIKTNLGFLLGLALRESGSELATIIESSLALSPHSAPQPDIVLTTEPHGDGFVPLASVRLVVEVSDTTLADDETRKLRLYAAARIPEYWIVDVRGEVIRQFWLPENDTYTEHRRAAFGETLTAVTIEGLSISTAGL